MFNGKQENPIEYPCQVVNRFECPYERSNKSKDQKFDVEDLFQLERMSSAVEILLAKARYNDSKTQLKSKGDLYNVLTERKTFIKILEQGEEKLQEIEDLRKYACQDKEYTVEYFMKLKDQINLDEMRFY